ncbi:NmrA family NAD(P)-binding protein [Candidatus Palauibacter polyketidifaciens]|uniref:NmrA family NAD(P)-binding protein n=1 Tax=Candidatus Palauibacter polyketidifaciens TaxID=3056740 RepID=UPI00238BBC08|nr:NmrA family NAD(P)-binding protein [Candidatus Palauibacter polyketidifaciens]MDE2719056.1 NmrA family NAD(P)-binding protein [Candidatus Palauibacter polyketidifaciens]
MADVLCVGGTGTVGRRVVEGLVARGASVRCLTRSADRAGASAGASGERVEFMQGDLERPDTLGPALEGVSRMHLLTALHPHEARLGIGAVDAAAEAGVERIVFHSAHRAHAAPHIPHFASKMEILAALGASGVPWATIEPNHYFQNDLWLRRSLEAGVYPAPLGGAGLHRVDVRDIADATVNALLDDGHEGIRYPVVGPQLLTSEHVARIWSEHLGREIEYVGDDLDAWEARASRSLPEWLVRDLRVMSEHFLAEGLLATEEDFATMSHVLGHAPRVFEDFVRETVAAWSGGGA